MGRQFGSIEMLETGENLQFLCVGLSEYFCFDPLLDVGHSWVPKVLIEEGNVFFDGWGEIVVGVDL